MNRYQLVETAFGYAALVFSIVPFRLLEIRLPRDNPETLCQPLEERRWPMDNHHPGALTVAAMLVRYFNGAPIDIPWPVMDLSRFTPYQQTVYRIVAAIPYGRTLSYGEVAALANLPRAARFVGTTMANNAYPVLIPCHRVIRSDGSIGPFGGGSDLKKRMLALEAAGQHPERDCP